MIARRFAERTSFATKNFTGAARRDLFRVMNPANYEVRRATVEDLQALRELWQAAGFNSLDLERRTAEFQVVAVGAQVCAGIGFRVAGLNAQVHSEVFADPANADLHRDLLWTRLQNLARNHGLVRLWTQERAPFWTAQKFAIVSGEVMAKLPAAFTAPGTWLALQLKDETAATNVDREFELFKQVSAAEREETLRKARVLKLVAVIISVAIFGMVALGAFLYFKHSGSLPRK